MSPTFAIGRWSHRAARALVGLGIVFAAAASTAEAQDKASAVIHAAERAGAPVRIDTAAVMRIAAIADTGRMSPGYRDISRYDSPGYCFAAVLGVENGMWRRGERRHTDPGSARDTLPSAAVAIGKKCLATLPPVAETRPIDLPNLLRLAIVVGDSARIEAVVARQVSLATSVEARGYVYLDAIEELLASKFPTFISHPAHAAVAAAFATRLDALGADARVPRMLAYDKLASNASTQGWDTTAIVRADAGLRTAVKLLTPAERREYTSDATLMYDSVKLVWYRQPPNLLAEVKGVMDRHIATFGTGSLTREQMGFMTGMMTNLAAKAGQPTPPITGKFWFPAEAAKVPEPGVVTLVTMVDKDEGLMSARMAMLQRVYNRYHARGFDILLVVKTQGYSWSSPPLAPEEEAKTIEWYFRGYLKLPFKLMVDVTPFTVRDDGKREPGPIQFELRYGMSRQAIIGRDGRTVSQWLGFESEAQMNAFVEQALDTRTANAAGNSGSGEARDRRL